jgi:hypothetical protein
MFLVGLLVGVVCFPLVWWTKNSVVESKEATDRIVSYLQNSTELQELLQDYENSAIYKRATE